MSQVEIPYGYCHCGCGQKTSIAKQSYKSKGVVNGQPMRFIAHHNVRVQLPVEERFWMKVNKSQGEERCWLWTAYKNESGYGQIRVGGKAYLAHRFAWQLINGEIPEGLHVLHNCPDGDNPACVNPKHMFLGTQIDNNLDMKLKGRARQGHVLGEQHHKAKLTADKVKHIRERHAAGDISLRQIGRDMGVSDSAIRGVINKKTWKHID